jgi:hypothetical protein
MATGPDDVSFQGKTRSSRPTTKMTRMTQLRHETAWTCTVKNRLSLAECIDDVIGNEASRVHDTSRGSCSSLAACGACAEREDTGSGPTLMGSEFFPQKPTSVRLLPPSAVLARPIALASDPVAAGQTTAWP